MPNSERRPKRRMAKERDAQLARLPLIPPFPSECDLSMGVKEKTTECLFPSMRDSNLGAKVKPTECSSPSMCDSSLGVMDKTTEYFDIADTKESSCQTDPDSVRSHFIEGSGAKIDCGDSDEILWWSQLTAEEVRGMIENDLEMFESMISCTMVRKRTRMTQSL